MAVLVDERMISFHETITDNACTSLYEYGNTRRFLEARSVKGSGLVCNIFYTMHFYRGKVFYGMQIPILRHFTFRSSACNWKFLMLSLKLHH
jgi:hypothetical protein